MVIIVVIEEARARSRTHVILHVLCWTTGVMGFAGRADHACTSWRWIPVRSRSVQRDT